MKTATEYHVPEEHTSALEIKATCPACGRETWVWGREWRNSQCQCAKCFGRFKLLPLDEVLKQAKEKRGVYTPTEPTPGEVRQIERSMNRNIVNPIQPIHDPVSNPKHYTGHPSGVECITVTEHMNFCRGNAVKYIWRAGDKGNEIEDLKKARWYIDREIQRLEGGA